MSSEKDQAIAELAATIRIGLVIAGIEIEHGNQSWITWAEQARFALERVAGGGGPVGRPALHILHHGLALCGLHGAPVGWPEGHRWVDLRGAKLSSVASYHNEFGEYTRCPLCFARARERDL